LGAVEKLTRIVFTLAPEARAEEIYIAVVFPRLELIAEATEGSEPPVGSPAD